MISHYKLISSREQEVLEQISKGYTSQEIATNLLLSYHTILTHRRSLLEKMEVNNTAGLITKAFELQLLFVSNHEGTTVQSAV